MRAVLYKRMLGWSSKASVGVERHRGRGLKPWCGRSETTAKVLKDRRSPRQRGRMGTSVRRTRLQPARALPIHGSNRHLFREPGEKHAYSALVGALRRVPEDAPDDDVADVVHVDARLGHRRLEGRGSVARSDIFGAAFKGVRSGVERRRGVSGLKARDPGRRETTAKVLKERRSPRERGRMGTSV